MDLVEIRAVPLPFRGPKEELQAAALALASMRIHRTCDFFMDASYELSPATGHTCCVIERIPFFLVNRGMLHCDDRFPVDYSKPQRENVESIP